MGWRWDAFYGLIMHEDNCHLVATEMRKALVKYIIENDRKLGFIIDESATISGKEGSSVLPEYTRGSSLFVHLITLYEYNTRAASVLEIYLSIYTVMASEVNLL
jgi:hypothetical protein